jgi:alpha-L-fucosidase
LSLPQKQRQLEIDLSAVSAGEAVPVLKITFEDGYSVIPPSVVTNGILTPRNAVCLFGHSSLNYYAGYKSIIGYDWMLRSRKSSVPPQITY